MVPRHPLHPRESRPLANGNLVAVGHRSPVRDWPRLQPDPSPPIGSGNFRCARPCSTKTHRPLAVNLRHSRLVEREPWQASWIGSRPRSAGAGSLGTEVRASQRQLRHLVRHDCPRAFIASLPRGLALETGRLEISFSTVEELAEVLLGVAQILVDEPDEFAQQFELKVELPVSEDSLEWRRLFARLAAQDQLTNCG